VDAPGRRAGREDRLAAALGRFPWLAARFWLHPLRPQGPGQEESPPGVRHAFELSEGDVLAFLDAVEEAHQVLGQVRGG
jgi:hypothetical protein